MTLPHLDGSHLAASSTAARERRRATELDASRRPPARSRRTGQRRLSGGNQQKVLFAKWLFEPPHVLIADEPTRGVDVGAKRAIYELIVSLAGEGMGVLLISSELEEVLGLAHRVFVMRAGRVVAEFDEGTFTEDAVMRAAFGDVAGATPTMRRMLTSLT